MSVFNVSDGSIQAAVASLDNVQISVRNGRSFTLTDGSGRCLKMKEMVRELKQYSKSGEDVSELKGKIAVLELQGQAMLANASLYIRIMTSIRQILGNLSFNKNLHFDRLDVIPTSLTDECQQFATKMLDILNDWKSTNKDSYLLLSSGANLMFQSLFFESLIEGSDPALKKKREALHQDTLDQVTSLNDNNKGSPLPTDVETKIQDLDREYKAFPKESKIALIKEIGKTHMVFSHLMLLGAEGTPLDKVEVLAQIKNFRPLGLEAFKKAEYY